ncbi:MAG: UPF0489 family protein [Candidatus Absconditabacterales bacterium]
MYPTGTFIHEPLGNNDFSYPERLALSSRGKIYVPDLIQGTLDDLEIGSEIAFEEVVDGKLITCKGLKHFLQIDYQGTPIFIVDNHNHALSFRGNEQNTLIHIDQHSDIKPNSAEFRVHSAELKKIEDFVNKETNVGNFITAATNSGIINKVIQIRTDYTLKTMNHELGTMNYILDIDSDFRQDKEITPEDIQIIRRLISQAKLVTIATSPYFMDQKKAIEIIEKLLSD